MRILLVNKFYYPAGGAETHFFALKKLLEDNGHEVAVFSMAHPKNDRSADEKYFVDYMDFYVQGFRKIIYALKTIYSFEAKRKMARILDVFQPDVVHLHSIGFQLTSSIIGPIKKRKIPIVQTLHEYKLICPNQRLFNFSTNKICEKCKRHRYYQPVAQKCLMGSRLAGAVAMLEAYLSETILKYSQKVDLFIAPSNFMKNKCQQWGIEARKIKMLRYFLDLKSFEPNYTMGNYILYFGRLAEEKGLMDLLKAAQNLPALTFKIAGTGPQEAELKKFIKENKLKNVELLGFKHGQALHNLIRASVVTVVPAVWYDNNPFAVFESMALGKIVIGSNLGGIPELIKDGQTGFIFKAGDVEDLTKKIKTAVMNADLPAMGAKARAFVEENFNAENYYNQLMKIYKQF